MHNLTVETPWEGDDFTPRITRDPAVMSGKPCVRGMRVTVGVILAALAGGDSPQKVLDDYPYLEREDILAVLQFASRKYREWERGALFPSA